MNSPRQKFLIRRYLFIVALSFVMIGLGVVSDGFTLRSIGAQSALTVAFIAILFMVLRNESRDTQTPNSKRSSVVDRLLHVLAFGGAVISMWLTFSYSNLKIIQALPYVLVVALLPICLVLLVRWCSCLLYTSPSPRD